MFYLFIAIIILTGVCVHLLLTIGLKNQFDKILLFFLFFIAFHSFHAATVRLFTNSYMYIDHAAPFGLLYGPLLYFAAKTLKGSNLSWKRIMIHAAPFLIGVPLYIAFLASADFRLYHSANYYRALYGLMALSWGGYTLWALFGSKRIETIPSDSSTFSLIGSIVIMFTLAVFMASTKILSGDQIESFFNSEFIIFSGMLGLVLFVYIHLMQRIHKELLAKKTALSRKKKVESGYLKEIYLSDSYQKTPIRDDLMSNYLSRINEYLDTKPYLNAQLSLDDISLELKIPKHHLSQIFSKKYGLSYSKLINTKRIEYACSLLQQPDYLLKGIDEIAELSGFESRSSFYRNFNLLKGCSPSRYIEQNQI